MEEKLLEFEEKMEKSLNNLIQEYMGLRAT